MGTKTIVCLDKKCPSKCKITTTENVEFGSKLYCPCYFKGNPGKRLVVEIPYKIEKESG